MPLLSSLKTMTWLARNLVFTYTFTFSCVWRSLMLAAEKKKSLLPSHHNISAKEPLGFRKYIKETEISSRCRESTPVFLQMPSVRSALNNRVQTQGHVCLGEKKWKEGVLTTRTALSRSLWTCCTWMQGPGTCNLEPAGTFPASPFGMLLLPGPRPDRKSVV